MSTVRPGRGLTRHRGDAGLSRAAELAGAAVLAGVVAAGIFGLDLDERLSCELSRRLTADFSATAGGTGCGAPTDVRAEPVLEVRLDAAPRAAPAPARGAATVGDMPAGDYQVRGLGLRKQEILAAGGTTLDVAVAMLESDAMRADYVYGDGKAGESTNFGIFKQNWHMLTASDPSLDAVDVASGARLNADLAADIAALHRSRDHFGELWFAGHRNGQTGMENPGTEDIADYRAAVLWIRDQLESDPAFLDDDTRFWVAVPPI